MKDTCMVNADTRLAADPDSLRVLIADDHRFISEAVANLLVSGAGFEVETVDSSQRVVKSLTQNGPFGIVLLDLKMPGMVGLDSVRQVLGSAGDAKVVPFTGQVDRHFLNHALDLGGKGLIPKTLPLQALTSVIRLIASPGRSSCRRKTPAGRTGATPRPSTT